MLALYCMHVQFIQYLAQREAMLSLKLFGPAHVKAPGEYPSALPPNDGFNYVAQIPSKAYKFTQRELSRSELVYAELCDLYRCVNNSRRSPRRFRAAFESYVFKSQQLTEVMRSEYLHVTGCAWMAASFSGWNAYTIALKKIRNAMAHGQPLILSEVVLSIYPASSIDKMWGEATNSKFHAYVIKSFINMPLVDKFTTGGMGLSAKKNSDSKFGRTGFVFPIKEFFFYDLDWQTIGVQPPEVYKRGGVGALKVVLHSFRVLQEYMDFYRVMLSKRLSRCPS